MNEAASLRELAEQKEREWRSIQEKRIEALESSLRQKTQELAEQKQKMAQLRDDFKYNLSLLEERDAELAKFEETLLAVRKQMSEKNEEISELKIKLDECKKIMNDEKNAVDECKKYFMNRLNAKTTEIEKYKASKDSEINKERNEIEKFKRTLQTQLTDLQFDLEKQRTELKTEFDEIMRKREHEWRLQAEEFSSTILARDLEIKMLKNELNLAKTDLDVIKGNLGDDEQTRKNLERKLKEKEWELKDGVALKDAKIKDLENKLNHLQTSQKTWIDDLNRKNEELDRSNHEKQVMIEKLKTSLSESEAAKSGLEQQIGELRRELSQVNASVTKQGGKNEAAIELERLRGEYRKVVEANSTMSVRNELGVEQLGRELDSTRKRLEESKERVAKLENELVHVNLQWQERYRLLEAVKVNDSDLFNRQVLDEKNQALDRIKLLEDQLRHKENVIQALQTNDQLLNGVVESNEFKLKEENERLKSIIKEMRQEMENLATSSNLKPDSSTSNSDFTATSSNNQKHVEITFQTPSKNISLTNIEASSTPIKVADFEEDLKRQLLESKQKNRQLQAQIDEYILNKHSVTGKLPDTITDNTIINSHIKTMNETVDILRQEKVDLTALAKKQQTKLMHMERLLNENVEQNRQKQAQIETLRYEMGSQMRRATHEVENLRQNVANLELELNATRREADEYHKATIEKASQVSALENKISELKLKLSTSGTQVNFGAQELFIQQLQDELKRLSGVNQQLQIRARQLHHELMRQGGNSVGEREKDLKITTTNKKLIDCDWAENEEINDETPDDLLRVKLKTAARYIRHLIREKEHLIEMSNRLRGELNRIKDKNESLTMMRLNRDVRQENEDLDRRGVNMFMRKTDISMNSPRTALSNQLEQLEKKQYELTKQQLAFAQLKNRTKSAPNLSSNRTAPSISRNKSPKPKTIESTSSDSTTNTVSSSVRSENLREIWKLLDENEHDENNEDDEDEIRPTRDKTKPVSANQLKVTGVRPPSVTTAKTVSLKSSKITPQRSTTPNNRNTAPKIRNYNIKD